MNQPAAETNQPKKTPGNPCPGCGCPYPGDHTQDCKWTTEQRIKALEGQVLVLADLTSKLADQLCHHQESFLRLLKVMQPNG
jgi:DNA repair exonuclease SbcCD ATPase subunit